MAIAYRSIGRCGRFGDSAAANPVPRPKETLMYLAFKRATFNSFFTPDGVMDRLISWWTQSPYCHVELVFDRSAYPSLQTGTTLGKCWCFSADLQAGVRFEQIDLSNPKEWMLVKLDVTPSEESKAYAYAKTLVGRKYNELGLLRFAIGPVKDPTDEDFCSQVCLTVLEQINLWKGVPEARVDPGFLYDLVTDASH